MWVFFVATAIFAFLLYKLLFQKNKNYWEQYGVPQIDTSSQISKWKVFLGWQSLFEGDDYAYEKLGSGKFCGIVDMGTPMLLVKDLELMKKVFIKDFEHFVDRREFFTDNDKSLKKMLPSLQGEEWKGVRSSVSPTFTTGKIRRMMEYFNSVGKEWVDDLIERAKASSTGSVKIDVLSSVNQYTVDVIASSVFGMSAGTIKNPKSTFSTMATRMSDIGTKQIFKFAMGLQFPRLYRLSGVSLIDTEAMEFFERILDQGLKSRMKGEVKRNDFLQLLVEAKKGELKALGADELSAFEKEAMIGGDQEKKQYLTEEIMNAQSLVFFFAGFSTTSNFITFAAYALAANLDVQEKLRSEVGKIVKEDGSFDYDDVGQLVYMDMVVCEILRKFPPAARLERLCAKEYVDKETGLFVPKGALVGIPVNSLHHDKRYYDNPDIFDPEHFSPERKAERNPYTFLPFGMGPRNCIGMRFALIESKTAIAHLVHNFRIEPTEKTPLPMQGRPNGIQLLPPKNLELKLTPL